MSPSWRPMAPSDLEAVERLGNAIHQDHPEDAEIFAERLRLCPQGCHALDVPTGLAGYIISHPWHAGSPPPLNTLLTTLPTPPGTWYIHDLALHPSARGTGAAQAIVARIAALATATGLPRMDLVAVGKSPGFWARHGFHPQPWPPGKTTSYGSTAQFMVRPLA